MSNLDQLILDEKNSNTARYRCPILRFQKKNTMKKQFSAKNLDTYKLSNKNKFKQGCYPEKNCLHKKNELPEKDLINPRVLNKSKSVSNYRIISSQVNDKYRKSSPIIRNWENDIESAKNDENINTKLNNNNHPKKVHTRNLNRNKTLPNLFDSKLEKPNLKNDNDLYYCINCYNRRLMLNNKMKNMNKSYDNSHYHDVLALKKLDEDYINNKVLENQRKQLRAFNFLKNGKNYGDNISDKERLQYINENEDNLGIGLNLQDYLYYNNKRKNEKLNLSMINNINLYKGNVPRKEIKDYYNKVQYQIPILEKKFGPSEKYRLNYIETLKKQINDKEMKKKKDNKSRIKTENEENMKFRDFMAKLKEDEYNQKKLKQKLMYDNNKILEEYQKKRAENRKKDSLIGAGEKKRKFNTNQNNYKYFINQQRLKEINSLQNWLNENMRQKQKKMDMENKENKKWDEYNKEYNRTFDNNTYAEKCADCNSACPINKLYQLNQNTEKK